MKDQPELDAERVYRRVLHEVVYPALGSKTTYGNDLRTYCTHMLGTKFAGVYPSDQVPRLTETTPYAIANLDTSDEPGSHWVALARAPSGKVRYYDSFGRSYDSTLAHGGGSKNTIIRGYRRDDAEQRVDESNCGARSCAYLLVRDTWGDDVSRLI